MVDTNLVGTLLGCKVAINAMLEEPQRKGHVFNMDGAGANGMVPCDTHRHRRLLVCNAPHHSLTRTTATVDAQLCGVRGDQGGASAAHEVAGQGDGRHQRTPPPVRAQRTRIVLTPRGAVSRQVGIHTLSPGMVLTDLLMSGNRSAL